MKHTDLSALEELRNFATMSMVDEDADLLFDVADAIELKLASARAIMQKFVDKVDRGMAKSIETYAEMKQWMEDER